ncbi:MAG: DinB family protein [Solirubrobacteraceae bacterium]
MREQDVFVLADRALDRVIGEIAEDHWEIVLPESFRTRRLDHAPTLREIVNYHAYDDAWVPDMLAGKTMDEAGAHQFDGDLLGENPAASFKAIVELACAAAQACDDLDITVHCSFGDYRAREYFWQINQFRALRAHDIAKVIGADPTLPDELVQGIWDELTPHIEEWRTIGVFGPAVPVPDDAPLQDRLLAITGRRP